MNPVTAPLSVAVILLNAVCSIGGMFLGEKVANLLYSWIYPDEPVEPVGHGEGNLHSGLRFFEFHVISTMSM